MTQPTQPTPTAPPLSGLDRAMTAAHAGMKSAKLAAHFIKHGETADAHEAATKAAEEAGRCVDTLQSLGGQVQSLRTANPIPLHLLSTPKGRALLDALRAALPLAEAVDQERGRAVPDAEGNDTTGLDLAEGLHHLILRLSDEVEGPKGKD